MEFACGFVYVPPPVNPNHETSIFKRSGAIFIPLFKFYFFIFLNIVYFIL